MTVPEGRAADKILERVKATRIIERLVRDSLEGSDIAHLVRSPGFIKLFALIATNFIKDVKVGVIIPLSKVATTLVTGVALTIDAEVCSVDSRVIYERKGFITTYYTLGSDELEVESLAIPRSCFKEGSNALLVDAVVNHRDKLKALLEVLKRFKMCVAGLIAIDVGEGVREVLKELGIKYLILKDEYLGTT